MAAEYRAALPDEKTLAAEVERTRMMLGKRAAPKAFPTLKMDDWTVYILRCSDETLYTGITKDVVRRVEEHNGSGLLGARYTRARRPVRLVYLESHKTRSGAAKREYEIKRLSREEKEALIRTA